MAPDGRFHSTPLSVLREDPDSLRVRRMATINSNYLKLKAGYLFPEIARRVHVYSEENPDKAARIIRCSIGDVTEPLSAARGPSDARGRG